MAAPTLKNVTELLPGDRPEKTLKKSLNQQVGRGAAILEEDFCALDVQIAEWSAESGIEADFKEDLFQVGQKLPPTHLDGLNPTFLSPQATTERRIPWKLTIMFLN